MNRASVNRFFKRKSVWVALYAIYFSLILLSVHAFIAEDSVDDIINDMDEKYDYKLVFKNDGITTHYEVTRYNTGSPAKITLTYWTTDNRLEITEVSNIKTLKINVQSMFDDESNKVFKRAPGDISTMWNDYWFEAGDGLFTIEFDIAVSESIESLTFTKFPTPSSVLVDHHGITDEQWWGGTKYTISGESISITNIPTGVTTVHIYFKAANQLPVALFTMNPPKYAGVNEDISFDGSDSYDPDGSIVNWVWDFGDSNYETGGTTSHNYSQPGNYTIRLTVRDNAEPFAEAWVEKTITIAYGAEEDTDEDGLRDNWEWEHFEDLKYGPEDDPDKDGFVNGLEYLAETDPANRNDNEEDSDGDTLADRWEWDYFKSLSEDQNGDADRDGKTNKEEHDAGTDPSDPESPPSKVEKAEEPGMDLTLIIVVVVVVVVILVIFMFILRSKKAKEEKEEVDEEVIAAMEAKIERAKKLGLPTGELERVLKEAKSGKPLSVEPVEKKKGKGKGSGRERDRGRPGAKGGSKRRR